MAALREKAIGVDPLKRSVIAQVVWVPSVLLPVAAGLAAGLVAWANGGPGWLGVAAAVGVLGGIGWMFARMALNVEAFSERALQARDEALRADQDAQLDRLARQLRSDRDHRTQDNLTLLRSLRSDFETAAGRLKLPYQSGQLRQQMNGLFDAAVDQLRQAYRLGELAESMSGPERSRILDERELVLENVQTGVDRLRTAVNVFQSSQRIEAAPQLNNLAEELESTLRIAKRTEERMRELENPSTGHEATVQE